eukprot:3037864-Rhodomonas_salina.1
MPLRYAATARCYWMMLLYDATVCGYGIVLTPYAAMRLRNAYTGRVLAEEKLREKKEKKEKKKAVKEYEVSAPYAVLR